MSDLFDFCITILSHIVDCYFDLNLGSYSYGLFVAAASVLSIFVGTLVISFRASGGSPASIVRPSRSFVHRKK